MMTVAFLCAISANILPLNFVDSPAFRDFLSFAGIKLPHHTQVTQLIKISGYKIGKRLLREKLDNANGVVSLSMAELLELDKPFLASLHTL